MKPPTLKRAKTVLKGKRFDIVRTPPPHAREIIVHPGAVVILPLVSRDRVAMIRNERIAAGETLWELPAGTLEPRESPAKCAARELIEETGFRAKRVAPLCRYFSSPGICTEVMYAFVATGLTPVGQELDAGEQITVEVLPMKRVMAMLKKNQIRDAKTIATLLYHKAFGKERR